MIVDGRFREDLYYRLAEIVVKIPRSPSARATRCCSRGISSIASAAS